MPNKNDIISDKILSTLDTETLMEIAAKAAAETDFEGEENDTEDIINYPKEGETYNHKDKLTLDIDGKPVTRKLNDWIRIDAESFHQAMGSMNFMISRDNFRILMSELRANHIEYYRKAVGLDILIDFPGQAQPIAAKGLYNFEPVKFYKWWASNEKKVFMTTREKIQLFLRVENIKKGTLLKKHVEFLNNLRSK